MNNVFFLYLMRKGAAYMKALEERITAEGEVLPGNILKVGSFLNHRVDVAFMMEMGREIAKLFADEDPTVILTIETSGIVVAMGAAAAFGIPLVFAKKNRSGNLSGEIFKTVVHSYTHNTDYDVFVEKKYLQPGERVLIVDDFLAKSKAVDGLIDIIGQARAELVGVCAAIEKGFQHGGDRLRANGVHVESLAIIDEMSDGTLTFRR